MKTDRPRPHEMNQSSLSRSCAARGLCLGMCCIATLLILAACGSPKQASESLPAGPDIEVQEVHLLLLPDTGSAYLTVINRGSEDDRLLRVETPLAATAETHETVDEDGVLRMVPRPDGFAVPAGDQLVLAPGGKHVMLMGLSSPEEGAVASSSTTLILHFERFGEVEVEAHVMRPTDGQPHEH